MSMLALTPEQGAGFRSQPMLVSSADPRSAIAAITAGGAD
jgi:hypothetical protein